jgi:hypothetical protein
MNFDGGKSGCQNQCERNKSLTAIATADKTHKSSPGRRAGLDRGVSIANSQPSIPECVTPRDAANSKRQPREVNIAVQIGDPLCSEERGGRTILREGVNLFFGGESTCGAR